MVQPTNESRLTSLEEQVTHQQHFIQQLNAVILDMRSELDAMKDNLRKNSEQLIWLIENQEDGSDLPNEKPPHY